jgi:hypothetical protein
VGPSVSVWRAAGESEAVTDSQAAKRESVDVEGRHLTPTGCKLPVTNLGITKSPCVTFPSPLLQCGMLYLCRDLNRLN